LVLNQETALFLKNDSDAFAQFLGHRAHMVTRFSFVLYLAGLDPRAKAFPMTILPAVYGHATGDTLSSLLFALQILEDEGIDVRGLAFDGDTKYLGFLTAFEALVDQIQKINLEGGLKGVVADKELGIFEHVLHLLKTIRYRFVKTVNCSILSFAAKTTINWERWRFLDMSDNLLSDSQAHKQEDELAMQFPGRKFLVGASEVGRFDLFLCLVPWILLKHAIFVEGYARTKGTSFLTLSLVILLAHFHLLIEQKKCRITQDDGKKSKVKQQPNLRPEQSLKALGSMFYTGREIARNELLNIGSLGPNEEEHFFGMHQSLAHGDDRFCKFIENSIAIAVMDQCIRDMGINLKIARRIGKSGIIPEPD
jgi:hypothetical protein